MKVLAFLIYPALVSMALAQCDNTMPSGKTCSGNPYSEADPEACSWFYFCDGNCVTRQQCKPLPQDGLPRVFDEVFGWCGYRSDVDCGSRPCVDPASCTTQPPRTTVTDCSDNPPLDCTGLKDDYYPNEFNCRKYWGCIGGKATPHMCPPDPQTGYPEVFDMVYKGCNFQEYTYCGDRPICGDCDEGCEYQPTTPADCSNKPKLDCSQLDDGWYPDQYNCQKYWHCNADQAEHLICPDGQLYNYQKVWCDYAANVQCGNRPICDVCDEHCHPQ